MITTLPEMSIGSKRRYQLMLVAGSCWLFVVGLYRAVVRYRRPIVALSGDGGTSIRGALFHPKLVANT